MSDNKAPRTYFDYSAYQNTGNRAIDMCAACIGHYRFFKKPLKTIYLHPRLFDLFRKGMEILMGRVANDDEKFEFDTVKIDRGSYLMAGKDLYVDFWPEQNDEPVLN
jgi:hypothetical protein